MINGIFVCIPDLRICLRPFLARLRKLFVEDLQKNAKIDDSRGECQRALCLGTFVFGGCKASASPIATAMNSTSNRIGGISSG